MLIKIENKKEDAYEAQLVVKLPKGVSYVKVQDVKAVNLLLFPLQNIFSYLFWCQLSYSV